MLEICLPQKSEEWGMNTWGMGNLSDEAGIRNEAARSRCAPPLCSLRQDKRQECSRTLYAAEAFKKNDGDGSVVQLHAQDQNAPCTACLHTFRRAASERGRALMDGLVAS